MKGFASASLVAAVAASMAAWGRVHALNAQLLPEATNPDSGSCEFEEIQLASDGAIELRSVEMGERVAPNHTTNGSVEADATQYYHLCILRHEHEHEIHINLTTSYRALDDGSGDANLFISSLDKYPRMGHAPWISQRPGNDFVKLYTYLDGFPRKSDARNRSIALHIGVVGVDAAARYNLTVSVLDLPINSDIASREEYYTRLHRAQQAQQTQRRLRSMP